MGCIFCNIVRMEGSPFKAGYGKVIEELAYDIASYHPEVVKKINDYVARLQTAGKEE